MSEALFGVIIGGLIASIGTILSSWLQHRRWKIENKIKILETRIKFLENESQFILEEFSKGLHNDGMYSSDMWNSLDLYFPEDVEKSINKILDEIQNISDNQGGEEDQLKKYKSKAYFVLSNRLKNTIGELYNEIDNLLK